jgi:hypothetical protein
MLPSQYERLAEGSIWTGRIGRERSPDGKSGARSMETSAHVRFYYEKG